MEQQKVKAPILLKIALGFLVLTFILSTAILVYLQIFGESQVVIPSSIRFLTDAMVAPNGYFYFVTIPGLIIVGLIIWVIFAKELRRERMLCKLEQTVPEAETVKMRAIPFQDVIVKGKGVYAKHDVLEVVVTRTVKSPIVPSGGLTSAASVAVANLFKTEGKSTEKPAVTKPSVAEEVPLDFSPSYLHYNDISSVSELKKLIAREKSPTVSICPNDDLSSLNEADKVLIERINSVDTDGIFEGIKQQNAIISVANEVIVTAQTEHVKEATCKHQTDLVSPCPQAEAKAEPAVQPPSSAQPPAAAMPQTQAVYLSADEIVALHRKEAAYKKQQGKVRVEIDDDEDKSTDSIAKFYYESNLSEYKMK